MDYQSESTILTRIEKNHERHYPSRQHWLPSLPPNKSNEQAPPPGLRQTDDLLPPPDPPKHRHYRHHDRLRTRRASVLQRWMRAAGRCLMLMWNQRMFVYVAVGWNEHGVVVDVCAFLSFKNYIHSTQSFSWLQFLLCSVNGGVNSCCTAKSWWKSLLSSLSLFQITMINW